jgi:hypothetical protein
MGDPHLCRRRPQPLHHRRRRSVTAAASICQCR